MPMSLSSGERELKSYLLHFQCFLLFVALFRRAWIEIHFIIILPYDWNVALFRRAWIEIEELSFCLNLFSCRSLQESVNWNLFHLDNIILHFCRSLQESVNWNDISRRMGRRRIKSLSSGERELKSSNACSKSSTLSVALFRRAWIEIGHKIKIRLINNVALFRRAWIEILK